MISQGSVKNHLTSEIRLMVLFMSKEDNHLKHNMWCQWGDFSCWAGKEVDDRLCMNSGKGLGKLF